MRVKTHTARGAKRGFTLLEVLVAIGALTFVAVAIATIFDAIGDTINRGKRVSELNRFASRIESVMRRDFEAMTRDGFLVIRHEFADGGKDVALFDGDADPKPRRVDQLMFFGAGEFSSSRGDIYAGMTPTSNEARIYYGHGQQRNLDYLSGSMYLQPDIRDEMLENGVRLGQPSTPGLPNPNEYAADWSLLRHVTVLAPPAPELAQLVPDFTDGGLYGYTADRNHVISTDTETESGIGRKVVVDRAYQVALQPAIPSVFWNTQPWFTSSNPNAAEYIERVANPVSIGYGSLTTLADARFSSGLVDVATTSLAEIKSIVTSAAFLVNDEDNNIDDRRIFYRHLEFNRMVEALAAPGMQPLQNYLTRYPFSVTSPEQQRAWMINALPSHPAEPSNTVEVGDPHRRLNNNDPTSPRIRFENIPPDLAGTLTDAAGSRNTAQERLFNAYKSADQDMLTRSVFVPRCTEFKVEWTFGEVYDDYSDEFSRTLPDPKRAALTDSIADLKGNPESSARGRALWKKFVWYGRDGWATAPDGKQVDLNGNGDRDYDPGDRTTFFYSRAIEGGVNASPDNVKRAMEIANQNGGIVYRNQDFPINIAKEQAKDPEHIVGREAAVRPNDSVLNGRRRIETATFGYYVYNPGLISQKTLDDLIINWPWPKLIRITFGLADPNNPGIETTYQVVFEVPDRETD